MYIPGEKISKTLKLVDCYSAKHELLFRKHDEILSLDEFLHVIEQEGFAVRVLISDLSEAAQSIKGHFVSKEDGSYDVLLLRGLNFCWKRLVLCKELFHVLMDSEEYRNMALEEHIEGSVGVAITEIKPNNAVMSEILAEIAAMELLFPYAKRIEAIANKFKPKDIAEKYKCPLLLIEKYLHPSNMQELKRN